jgi:hypothetical protein
VYGKQRLVGSAGVLAALVSGVQKLRWRAALKGRQFEGFLGQFVGHMFVHGPTDQTTGEQIQHSRPIQRAFIRSNRRDVYQPLAVGGIRRELTA